jgi:plastocyanin
MLKRVLANLPVLAMLALAAACGGDNGGDDTAAAGDTATSAAPAPAAPEAAPTPAGTVHEVRMVTSADRSTGTFEPATITVRKGDTIRWTTDGLAPHNVNFQPLNPNAANLPPAGQYLTMAAQTYEAVINMDPGTYEYQCDPHALLGMRGTVTVQ